MLLEKTGPSFHPWHYGTLATHGCLVPTKKLGGEETAEVVEYFKLSF